MKGKARLLSAALLIALAPVAQAQTAGEVDTQVSTLDTTTANRGQTQVATRIAASFTSLTGGSQDESLALVNALRNGTPVTLTETSATGTTGTGTTTTTTTITPPTGKMGWGEVFISLALAKAELAKVGITHPTDAQLQAALTGGTITKADGTTVTVKGVLEMRADGMGWGQIAKAEGTKLGPVVSSIKSAHTKIAALPATTSGSTTGTATPVSKSAATKGITTAAGSGVSGAGSGKSHKGIVTADGSSGAAGHGHSSAGRGLVTAAGGTAGGLSTAGVHTTHTSGVVTGAGASAATVTTAQGGGNAGGNGHGKGKGGG